MSRALYSVGDPVAVIQQDFPDYPEMNTRYLRVGVVTGEDDGIVRSVKFGLDEHQTYMSGYDPLIGASSRRMAEIEKEIDTEALIEAIQRRGDDRFFTHKEVYDFFVQFVSEKVPA